MKDNLEELVVARPFQVSDFEFIISTWIRGLYYGNSWFKEIPKDIFMKFYQRVITDIMASQNTTAWVACLKEDPDVIVGYAAFHLPDVVHYVYVKEAWRHLGIASYLVKPHAPKYCSHLTKAGLKLKPKEMIFNPFNL